MNDKSPSARKTGLAAHLQRHLVSGLLLLVPVYVTLAVLYVLFKFLVGWLGPALLLYGKVDLPGYVIAPLSVLTLVLVVYLTGVLTRRVVGRRLFAAAESRFAQIPLVSVIYSSVKSLTDLFSKRGSSNFKSLVVVDFPRPGMKCLAFVTGTVKEAEGRLLVKIFLPTAPNPTSGFFILLPVSEVFMTSLSVEEGMKMIISGGIISPERLDIRPATDADFSSNG